MGAMEPAFPPQRAQQELLPVTEIKNPIFGIP